MTTLSTAIKQGDAICVNQKCQHWEHANKTPSSLKKDLSPNRGWRVVQLNKLNAQACLRM